MDIRVKGVLGEVHFDGVWITITKRQPSQRARDFRLRAADVNGTRLKPGTRLFHGYVQFVLSGSLPAAEKRSIWDGGRPPHEAPHSLSIRRRSNDAATKLIAAVEQARSTE
ncbi:DUF4429 domain-containing protein [Streptomyces sp. RK9]|uniref:DUF4429 domain-containing protein n=1 Tax=Streptomyces sp. RK9 TaxID=3239284 RepID=UPI003868A195